MFKPSALLGLFLPCCATTATDSSGMQALLDEKNIGILSAACCDSTAGLKDEGLKNNLRDAMQKSGDQRAVVVQTITAAQTQLRALESQANPAQKQLIQNVVALFQANGLAVFPLLIINGRIAYYGGIPSADMIQERLQKTALSALSS